MKLNPIPQFPFCPKSKCLNDVVEIVCLPNSKTPKTPTNFLSFFPTFAKYFKD